MLKERITLWILSVLTLVLCFDVYLRSFPCTPMPVSISPKATTTKQNHSQCTAELLTMRTEWVPFSARGNGKKYAWKLSPSVQEECFTAPFNTSNTIFPLQSSPNDIQTSLQNKWIFFMGDSSVRMLYDYLVGRWLGEYQSWPSEMNQHGPSHKCKGWAHEPGNEKKYCYYDVFHQGIRLTFLWSPFHLSSGVDDILGRTVGVPDVMIAQHSYWEGQAWFEAGKDPTAWELERSRDHANSFVTNLTDVLLKKDELSYSEYPRVYGGSSPDKKPHRVWMSAFEKNGKRSYWNTSYVDGSVHAKEQGWDSFDRSVLVEPRRGNMDDPAHPKDERLEIELELILLLIRNH